MARFSAKCEVLIHVDVEFEVDDEDAGDDDVLEEGALDAADDAVFADDGQVQHVQLLDAPTRMDE